MTTYRLNRNLESSLIDYLRAQLTTDGWQNISVEKSMPAKEFKPAVILIQVSDIDAQKREIGSGKFIQFPRVTIRIFAENDGQREDLSNWLLDKLEADIPYYHYVITAGTVSSKIVSGNIVVLRIIRDEKELANTNPDVLEKEDRYRHNLTFNCYVGEY